MDISSSIHSKKFEMNEKMESLLGEKVGSLRLT